MGNGGWMGRGFGHGSQNQLHFLRVRHTDFIFSVVAEELGWIGAMLVLMLLFFVVWRLLRIADLAQDHFGRLVAVGVAAIIFFQTVVNVGMNMSLMPVTGLTLPFVSYGGSSLVSMLMAIGLAAKRGHAPSQDRFSVAGNQRTSCNVVQGQRST